MFIRPVLFALILFSLNCTICGQTVRGKIYEARIDSTIEGVNVFNLTTKRAARSGKDGSYEIPAREGEVLIFSLVGYKPDTVVVDYSMTLIRYDITFYKEIITLKNVTVTSSYAADSLARRNYYSHIYEKQPGITGRNTPVNGFGISFSPVSFFSKESKQKRRLKKRLIKEEQESYIDRSFPQEWISRLTGLRSDSLYRFMALYRPSYEFCRKTSRDGMIVYISDKFKEFTRPKA